MLFETYIFNFKNSFCVIGYEMVCSLYNRLVQPVSRGPDSASENISKKPWEYHKIKNVYR